MSTRSPKTEKAVSGSGSQTKSVPPGRVVDLLAVDRDRAVVADRLPAALASHRERASTDLLADPRVVDDQLGVALPRIGPGDPAVVGLHHHGGAGNRLADHLDLTGIVDQRHGPEVVAHHHTTGNGHQIFDRPHLDRDLGQVQRPVGVPREGQRVLGRRHLALRVAPVDHPGHPRPRPGAAPHRRPASGSTVGVDAPAPGRRRPRREADRPAPPRGRAGHRRRRGGPPGPPAARARRRPGPRRARRRTRGPPASARRPAWPRSAASSCSRRSACSARPRRYDGCGLAGRRQRRRRGGGVALARRAPRGRPRRRRLPHDAAATSPGRPAPAPSRAIACASCPE